MIFPSWKNHNSADTLLSPSWLRSASEASAQQCAAPTPGTAR
jgi:hypothetical protein